VASAIPMILSAKIPEIHVHFNDTGVFSTRSNLFYIISLGILFFRLYVKYGLRKAR